MSLSARHQRQVAGGHSSGIKEEIGGEHSHLIKENSMQHSPEISSTQGQ